jgi:enoyl-CoA hydratase/carnithine racemase
MLADRSNVLVIDVPRTLSRAFATRLSAALDAIDDVVRVVAFVGTDPEVFSLGMDLETHVRSGESAQGEIDAIGEALVAVHRSKRPTIGIARGRAVGGGVGLLAGCDFVLAEATATFALPEMLWGFVPAAIWPLVTGRIGSGRARTWAMTAYARGAAEAQAAGLVDEIASADKLAASADRVVRHLARVDRHAIALLRSWSLESAGLPVGEAIARGAALSARQLADERVKARLKTFFVDGALPWESGT